MDRESIESSPSELTKLSWNRDRGWDKAFAELGYTLRGMHSFISYLRSMYRSACIDYFSLYTTGMTAQHGGVTYYFNLCEHEHFEQAVKSIVKESNMRFSIRLCVHCLFLLTGGG